MKNLKFSIIVQVVMLTLLLSLAGGLSFAADGKQMSPELNAKREMVRKQQEQRITPEKRKAAAEALKAERIRLYNAKQAVKGSAPQPIETK